MSAESKLQRTPLHTAILVTVSAAFSLGLAFALYVAWDGALHRAVIVIFSAVVLGLAIGLVARLALPGRSWVLRYLLSLFGVCLGLMLLGWLSRGRLGIGLLLQRPQGVDWNGLGQVALAAATAWLSVRAWTGSERRVQVQVSARRGRPASLRARLPRIPTRVRRPRIGARSARRTAFRRRPSPPAQSSVLDAPRRVRGPFKARARVRLSEAVEQRCPYCLELVAQDDPRGVKVCPECHTWHHADCWAVTGICQVPHHHAS